MLLWRRQLYWAQRTILVSWRGTAGLYFYLDRKFSVYSRDELQICIPSSPFCPRTDGNLAATCREQFAGSVFVFSLSKILVSTAPLFTRLHMSERGAFRCPSNLTTFCGLCQTDCRIVLNHQLCSCLSLRLVSVRERYIMSLPLLYWPWRVLWPHHCWVLELAAGCWPISQLSGTSNEVNNNPITVQFTSCLYGCPLFVCPLTDPAQEAHTCHPV